ncbi:MAG TPA: DUF1634 domain-containing protein [Symbiobacteriaceae bacterium]|nr:DUF1634 domain-containing protein [Symbiobacteriaceae bacterium]
MEMSQAAREEQLHHLEERIVNILRLGVIVAAVLMSGGLLLGLLQLPYATPVMTTGLVVLLLTPIFRVAATFLAYIWAKDWVYVTVSAIVLFILALGALLGETH